MQEGDLEDVKFVESARSTVSPNQGPPTEPRPDPQVEDEHKIGSWCPRQKERPRPKAKSREINDPRGLG